MKLDNMILTDFAAAIISSPNANGEQTTRATVISVDENDDKLVTIRIDGSNEDTAATTTVKCEEDDRVMVLLKGHKATVIGNISSPVLKKVTANDIVAGAVTADAITTQNIESDNENSWINFHLGTFNFGEKLIWDGSDLTVRGTLTAGAGSKIGPWMISDDQIYKDVIASGTEYRPILHAPNAITGSTKAFTVAVKPNGQNWTYPFAVTYDGSLTATKGTIGPWNIDSNNSIWSGNSAYGNANGMYFGTSGLSLTDKFKVSSAGVLSATGVSISGTLTAGANSKIGPWTISANSIWRGTAESYGTAGNLYFGTSGLSLGSTFKVSNAGVLTCTSGFIGNWKIDGSLKSNLANFSSYINPDVLFVSSTASGINASLSTSGLQVEQTSSGAYTAVRHNGIETTGSITAAGGTLNGNLTVKGLITTDNGHVRSAHATDAHTYAWNTTTTCYASCRSQSDGAHGLYSNGYWNGSAFVNDGRYLIRRNTSNNTIVPSELYTHNEGYTTLRPVVGTNAGSAAVGVVVSSASNFGIYARWGAGDTAAMSGRTISCPASDIRLKENVEDSTIDALSVINAIKIRQFDWKDKSRGHWDCGMVVDEMEKDVDPKFCIGGEDDEDGTVSYKSVDTFYLQGYEVKAIQELSARVEELERRLNERGN